VAHRQFEQALAGIALADDGAKAAKKWMTFAHNAFELGTGDPRDLLEGLVAWLQARRVLYEAVRDAHLARADLWAATGHDTALEAGAVEASEHR
jgi:outer membrane protein TolC